MRASAAAQSEREMETFRIRLRTQDRQVQSRRGAKRSGLLALRLMQSACRILWL